MNDQQQMRQVFIDIFDKMRSNSPMTALEQQVAELIVLHPEYEEALCADRIDTEYRTNNNPFLHLSLHLGLLEQVNTDRPKGIAEVYRKMCQQVGDAHQAQHRLMDVLGECLWQAQRDERFPSEEEYLTKLQSVC